MERRHRGTVSKTPPPGPDDNVVVTPSLDGLRRKSSLVMRGRKSSEESTLGLDEDDEDNG